jgi:hypothetical protein
MTLSDKPLPPKPTLRAQDSPERRGVFDATDLTAKSLNNRFPALEPTSSPVSSRSDQQSPDSGSFQVTPSLLSSDHSPNNFVSTGVVEYGVAASSTIQSVINPYADDAKVADTRGEPVKHSSPSAGTGSSSSNYSLNAPGSTKPSRHGSVLQNDHPKHGTPSRSSCQSSSGIKINRSMLRGRQAISVRGRNSLGMGNARPVRQGAVHREDVRADLSLATTISGCPTQRARSNNPLEESSTDEGTLRISSKYGYNIRESFEARDAIMGQPGSSKPKARLGGLLSTTSTAAGRSGHVRELNLELATPNTKFESKTLGGEANTDYAHFSSSDEIDGIVKPAIHRDAGTSGMASRIGYHASALRPPTRKPLHPPRTSSLPSTPSPPYASGSGSNVKIGLSLNGRRVPVPKMQIGGGFSSESGEEAPPASRLSLFYRQTAASTARASFNAKKISEPQPSVSRIPHSRTFASLGDVGKGMKNLGKKVSKIIPGCRSIAIKATSEELLTITAEDSTGPRRQASRLLTTYKNSGMGDSSDEDLQYSANIGDGFVEPQPVDRHEPEGAETQKAIWRGASRNYVHDTESGGFIQFGERDGGNGDEDERPPSRRGNQGAPGGHYVEDAVEDGGDGPTGNTVNYPSNEDDESAEDTQLPPTRRGSVENRAAADSLISDARFDQMIAQTDTQAHQLLDHAMALEESHIRTLMIESATHLGEGLMRVRQARIQVIRVNQAIDEISVLLAANTHRMDIILQDISARST